MSQAITQHSKSEGSSDLVFSTPGFHHGLEHPFSSPSKGKPLSLSETLGSGLESNVETVSSKFDTGPTATRLLTFLYIELIFFEVFYLSTQC